MKRPGVDVVVIGLGAAGGVMAKELAAAGMSVVALERGAYMAPEEIRQRDELRMSVRSGLSDNANQPSTWRRDVDSPSVVEIGQASGVGGASLLWSALVWRLHRDDFAVRSSTIQRYGEEALPADSLIADWPFGYDELEPWYELAERELGVSGVWAQGGGNPFEVPRKSDFPLPPLLDNPVSRVFSRGAKALGYHPFPAPAAILSRDYTGPLGIPRKGCAYCGFCRHHLCHVGAKTSSLETVVPAALATGNLEIRDRCTAVSVNLDADGRRARGVSYYDPTGTLMEQDAEIVVVAAGSSIETVRLLMLSQSDRYPTGLGDSTDWLGKAFTGHPRPSVVALFDDQILNGHVGPNHVKAAMDDLNADNFDHTGLGFIRGGVVFTDVGGSGGPLSFYKLVPPGMPRWGSAYKAYLARYFTRHLQIGAWLEYLPNKNAFVDLDPQVKDRLGLPVARVTARRQPNDDRMLAFMLERMQEIAKAAGALKWWVQVGDPLPESHMTGGTRMGTDPVNSVTNQWGQLWDAPNVFVSSTALYPTCSGLNPTLTIWAQTYRQAARIKELRGAAPAGQRLHP